MEIVSEEIAVPLSEDERKRLAELEQELVKNDPELAQELKSGRVHFWPAVSSVAAGLTALVGMLLIVVGISTQLIIVGVLGFIIMGAAAYWIFSKRRPRGRAQ
jgi:ABC-type multidrug transport system fused ATPase/permease subunit